MAKPEAAKNAPAALANRPNAPSEIVDTRTGEVAAMEAYTGNDALDNATLAVLGAGDLSARLAKAKSAKKEDFGSLDPDFWDPGAPGTPAAVIQGVYVGSAKNGRLIQHVVVVTGTAGNPVVVRLNGRHGLTSALKQCEPKDLVRIEYLGEKTSMGLTSADGAGKVFKEWDVRKLSV